MDAFNVAIVVLVVGLGLYASVVGRRRIGQALRASFDALRFATPAGDVGGDAVRVVKVYKQGLPMLYDDVFDLTWGARQVSDSFWYCVAPGPSYFLAIPLVAVGMGRVDIRWVVRPLSEARMRGALVDHPDALRGDGVDPVR